MEIILLTRLACKDGSPKLEPLSARRGRSFKYVLISVFSFSLPTPAEGKRGADRGRERERQRERGGDDRQQSRETPPGPGVVILTKVPLLKTFFSTGG